MPPLSLLLLLVGFWSVIAEHIGPTLTPEQAERIYIGFQVYLEKRLPLVLKLQEIMQQLQHLLGCPSSSDQEASNCCDDKDKAIAATDASSAGSAPVVAAAAAAATSLWTSSADSLRFYGSGSGSGSGDGGAMTALVHNLTPAGLYSSTPELLEQLLHQLSQCTTQLWEVSRWVQSADVSAANLALLCLLLSQTGAFLLHSDH